MVPYATDLMEAINGVDNIALNHVDNFCQHITKNVV